MHTGRTHVPLSPPRRRAWAFNGAPRPRNHMAPAAAMTWAGVRFRGVCATRARYACGARQRLPRTGREGRNTRAAREGGRPAPSGVADTAPTAATTPRLRLQCTAPTAAAVLAPTAARLRAYGCKDSAPTAAESRPHRRKQRHGAPRQRPQRTACKASRQPADSAHRREVARLEGGMPPRAALH